jgi:hypothetical protein
VYGGHNRCGRGSLSARSTIACLSASAEPPCTGVLKRAVKRGHSASSPSGSLFSHPRLCGRSERLLWPSYSMTCRK